MFIVHSGTLIAEEMIDKHQLNSIVAIEFYMSIRSTKHFVYT